ncbi:hypothetical protein CPC08DRAFT_629181 [Agrocybe pediades]|nr:hypothetical protein CPC08DRAFT_629181 [Agrocybe pediades]
MGSNRVGSVFLGDIQRHRHLSSSTHGSTSPPSSPPPTTSAGGTGQNSIAGVFSFSQAQAQAQMHSPTTLAPTTESPAAQAPGKVDPVLALELRLRWLEALVFGMKQDTKGKAREEYAGVINYGSVAAANLKPGETLARLAQSVQTRLRKAVEGNEGLRRFMDNYDKNAHLLTPSFALSGTLPDPPTYDKMSPEEINALLAEMEPDIRAADRDMQEIDALEKKGVLGAGHLPDYEKLSPRLEALLKSQEEDAKLAQSLELRISSLVDKHATYIDTLSELFVAWDDTLTETEDKVTRMERDKAERVRLGLA